MESTDNIVKDVTIHRLPHSTVKLLSSGQVITSVSSAVKELVENAIDAGASSVEIKLENEGFDKIEVKDNGYGIRQEDVHFMCQRRYTSKIRDFGDLDKLNSYGFRGEALSSLCAISELSVTTKTRNDDVATCYSFSNEGEIISSQIAHLVKGTIITVQGLFKNLPVRKQYLSNGRRKAQELKTVTDVVKSFGLIRPNLRIVLSHNKFLIWQKSSVNLLKESLVQVIPVTVAKYLHEINYVEDKLKIQLMLPAKDCHIWNTCYGVNIDPTNIFVNSRPIKNKQIEKVVQEQILQYFGSAIPNNKTPFCLIAITLPTNVVDVNLEPNKTKVIIKDMEHVTKVLVDQVVLYYFGALEPPKPNIEDVLENNLKRKNVDQKTPTKTKIVKKTDDSDNVTPKKSRNERSNSLSEEISNSRLNETEIKLETSSDPNEGNIKNVQDNSQYNSDITNNYFCETEIMEADTSFHLDMDINELESVLVKAEQINKSNEESKNVTVSIENSEEKSETGNELVGIMSDDCEESSNDSITTDFLQRIRKHFEDSMDTDNVNIKTSTQEEHKQVDAKESIDKQPETELKMNEITLSQWSRGDVKLNGQVVESSTVVGNKEEMLQREFNHLPSSTQENLLERSISSQMGCKQMSAFTKFAKEMHTKIIQQKPGSTFTAVASELASQWRNLHENDKKMYEEKAKEVKAPTVTIIKNPVKIKDPSYRPKINSVRYNPPTIKVKKYPKNESIDISIDKLKLALEKRINSKSPEQNLITTLKENLIFLHEKGTVTVASIERIKEAIALHQNLEQLKIPLKLLGTRIPVLKSELGPDLWSMLDSLETCFDDTFKTIVVVCDERITKNGFRIEKIPGVQENVYFITDIPSDIENYGLNELKEILQFININKAVKLRHCRPAKILNFIKNETLENQTFEEFVSLSGSNILDMYRYWSQNVKGLTNNCPHFRPVCKLLFPLDSVLS